MDQLLKHMIDQGWGDIASIFGLIVALIGFTVTFYGVWKSRTAAESAKTAANEARRAIQRTDVISNFSSAVTVMEEIKRLHRAQAWAIMPDRYSSLRQLFLSIITNHPDLEEKHLIQIRTAISQFRVMEDLVESFLSSTSEPLNSAKLNKMVTTQIDKLVEVLNLIKSEAE